MRNSISFDPQGNKLRVIVDNLPALVSYFDLNYRYVDINKAYETWFDLKKEDVLGKRLNDVVGEVPFNMLKPHIDQIFNKELESTSVELLTPYKFGGLRYVNVELIADTDHNGTLQGVVVMVNDITNLKVIEAEEIKARKKAESLLNSVSHLMNSKSSEDVIKNVFVQINEIFNPDLIALIAPNSDNSQLSSVASSVQAGDGLSIENLISSPANSPFNDCLVQMNAIFLKNKQEALDLYPQFEGYASDSFEALALLPIVVNNRAECLVCIAFKNRHVWVDDEKIYLRTLNTYCSLAYEKATFLEIESNTKLMLQRLFNEAPLSVLVATGDDFILEYMNTSAANTFDLDFSYVGKSMFLIEHADKNSSVFAEALSVLQTGAPSVLKERKLVRPDGVTLTFDIIIEPTSGVLGPNFEKGVVLYYTDVTESLKARETIENHHKWLEAILDSLTVPLVLINKVSKHVFFANNSARHNLKDLIYDPSTFDSKHPTDINTSNMLDSKIWPLIELAEFKNVYGEEIQIRNKDLDHTQDYLWSSVCIPKLFGRDEIVVLAFQEITDLKNKEQQLQLAQREAEKASESKSRFLANMSHEIRTPLNAILGFSDILKQEDLPTKTKEEFAGIIERNGNHLSNLINDVLDFSKIEAGYMLIEKIPCSITEILNDIQSLFLIEINKKGIEFNISANDIPPLMLSDPLRLKQVLTNLIGNAVKFTSEGFIDIRMKKTTDEHGNSKLLFEIEDSGIGLNDDQIKNLFTLFSQADSSTTRKYGGTGLGLALSRAIANLMGGSLDLVSSDEGRGALFAFSVPWTPYDSEGIQNLTELRASDGQLRSLYNKTVLIADDSKDNRRLINHYLRDTNMVVSFATDGIETLEKAKEFTYDLILMDVEMPGQDGYSVTKKLRKLGYDKPIIALTANALDEDRNKSLRAGCDDHLTKPIDKEKLISTIFKLLTDFRKDSI